MKLNPTVSDRSKGTAGGRGVVCAVLMPHAPILIPKIGGNRTGAVAASVRAMREAAACVMCHHPDSIVVISPHAPRQPESFGIWADNPLQGSFAQFNAPQIAISLSLDLSLSQAVAAEAGRRNLATWEIHRRLLDHGALVPFWFLAEAGWAGPVVVLSLNYPNAGGLIALGESIAAAAGLSCRIALVASGDMSHRLTPDAPCGFHPQARRFDETLIQLVRAGEYRQIEAIAPKLRECAAEDAVDSTLVAAAAVNWQTAGHRVLNYEGPFGVGYGVAILFAQINSIFESSQVSSRLILKGRNSLPGVARRSVMAALRGGSETAPAPDDGSLSVSSGVFVTIRHRNGRLRGCVGTITPACSDLLAETWRSARLAAFKDNRFAPITESEMDQLRFEVNVLHPSEKIASVTDLDPACYGVIVTAADGRRGLLLPGIEEITLPEQQLRLAREKGWIDADEPVTLERFQVDHFEESD